MEKDILKKLKSSLGEIKIKQNEFKREKNKKSQNSIDSLITVLKNNLISNYNLLDYDLYIKSESHNTEFFIHDVESVILKIENKQLEE
ncbi:hypothetical protein [Flavobacterium yafengii]|uniref:hypothetical protein n=1 Tax=Flavobacterium yafengii TaxID=3041253 RepID=UPI0024A9E46C|nr:hypothetical protein [Flavobacterium yafengii]MDI5897637.1 hypothetical protein [Flavobacterium yafengii]